ncbi:MAG: hypothetical protein FGM45_01080 [Actinobacteria bacterium]|nr:hypothetical protein [Actinomycetota bacterium]
MTAVRVDGSGVATCGVVTAGDVVAPADDVVAAEIVVVLPRELVVRSLVAWLRSRPLIEDDVSGVDPLEKVVHSGRSRRNGDASRLLVERDVDVSLWVGSLRRRVI